MVRWFCRVAEEGEREQGGQVGYWGDMGIQSESNRETK